MNMLVTTQKKYQKSATSFYKTIAKRPLKVEDIIDALSKKSHEIQPKSFTNLKQAIAFDLQRRKKNEWAKQIKSFANPAVKDKSYPQKKRKIKTLSKSDREKIIQAVLNKGNRSIIAAVILAHHLGCRPVEMPTVKREAKNTFLITSAKKDVSGQRGIDRRVSVSNTKIADNINTAILRLRGVQMEQVRNNFSYLMKKTFPRRKKRPTLYYFRHQLASNLKASGVSLKEMAYIMGHQSTRTQENYGYSKSGGRRGHQISAAISCEKIESLIRDPASRRAQAREARFCNNDTAQMGLR